MQTGDRVRAQGGKRGVKAAGKTCMLEEKSGELRILFQLNSSNSKGTKWIFYNSIMCHFFFLRSQNLSSGI